MGQKRLRKSDSREKTLEKSQLNFEELYRGLSGTSTTIIQNILSYPVENSYEDSTTMFGDQVNQTLNYFQYVTDIDTYYQYLGTTTGALSDYRELTADEVTIITNRSKEPIDKIYADAVTMYADQKKQKQRFLYRTSDDDSHFEYLGTKNGDATDYKPVGGAGSPSIPDNQIVVGTGIGIEGSSNFTFSESLSGNTQTHFGIQGVNGYNFSFKDFLLGGAKLEFVNPTGDIGIAWDNINNIEPGTIQLPNKSGTFALLDDIEVTKVGTPVNNELAVWTGDGTIESATSLTFDGAFLENYVDGGGFYTEDLDGAYAEVMSIYTSVGDSEGNYIRMYPDGINFRSTTANGQLYGPTSGTNLTWQLPPASGTLGFNISGISEIGEYTDPTYQLRMGQYDEGHYININDSSDSVDIWSKGNVNIETPSGNLRLKVGTTRALTLDLGDMSLSKTITFPSGSGTLATEAWVTANTVTKVGTPVNNELAVWTGDGTLEGVSGITYGANAGELLFDIASYITIGEKAYMYGSGFSFDDTGISVNIGSEGVTVKSFYTDPDGSVMTPTRTGILNTLTGGANNERASITLENNKIVNKLYSDTNPDYGGTFLFPLLSASDSTTEATLGLKDVGYTVAGLPSGTLGDRAYVTDATAPTFLGSLTGGGAVKCPVCHNGTAWVSA